MLGEEAQELRLAGERQLLDMIEHQRAAFGPRHPPDLAALGAGESAGAIAEELALEERCRERRRIELDERRRRPRTGFVHEAREGRTAGTGLAQNENRGGGGSDLLQGRRGPGRTWQTGEEELHRRLPGAHGVISGLSGGAKSGVTSGASRQRRSRP